MQKIPLDLAAPGMKLAKPVTKSDGLVLVGAGVELTTTIISRFRASGVQSLTVQGRPVDLGDDGGNDLERIAGRLDHLFRKHGQDRFMVTLRNMLRRFFAERIAAAKAAEEAEAAAIAAAAEAAREEAEAQAAQNRIPLVPLVDDEPEGVPARPEVVNGNGAPRENGR
ncbi:hypothetical protein [Nitratidesulfovibrio liaohensis]|uniref:hypothetical protein n=1 Tax=Nitratidesulfovibrio liaohensis TaxID=2604158 RepID=UPI001421F5F5|nr:hypothetical protein [Nitratidesulfovibrio liaohensis]NHZ45801.1 hypothetical protein [Nitratidesulfovibrio liaohensis]